MFLDQFLYLNEDKKGLISYGWEDSILKSADILKLTLDQIVKFCIISVELNVKNMSANITFVTCHIVDIKISIMFLGMGLWNAICMALMTTYL